MTEKASEIIGFGPSALWVTIGVLIALAVIAVLIMDLIIKAREVRKPKLASGKSVEDKLASDNERLRKLEDTTARQDDELKLILRSQMAMIHHMVDGNNTQKLREAQDDIEEYLISGKIRKEAD